MTDSLQALEDESPLLGRATMRLLPQQELNCWTRILVSNFHVESEAKVKYLSVSEFIIKSEWKRPYSTVSGSYLMFEFRDSQSPA